MKEIYSALKQIGSDSDQNIVEVDASTGMPDCGDRIKSVIAPEPQTDSSAEDGWANSVTASYIVDTCTRQDLSDIWFST